VFAFVLKSKTRTPPPQKKQIKKINEKEGTSLVSFFFFSFHAFYYEIYVLPFLKSRGVV